MWAAIPAIAFAIFIVYKGGLIFALAVLGLGLLALHELYELLGAVRPVKLAGFLGLIALVFAARYGTLMQVLLMLVALIPVLFLLTVARPWRDYSSLAIAVTALGVLWIGLAIAHAVLLRDLAHGGGIIFDVLFATFIGDTGAYFGGRVFGRRPLAPSISPSKTVEGLVAGMITTVIALLVADLYQDWLPADNALLLGIGVALAAPLGDLFESLIKRDAGAKDAGRFFGPHGGVLDRLDAALFTIPTGYYIWSALL